MSNNKYRSKHRPKVYSSDNDSEQEGLTGQREVQNQDNTGHIDALRVDDPMFDKDKQITFSSNRRK